MRRIIRIFLASSIVEFVNERMAIENFIRNISDKFEENYDVKIQPLLCENFDDAYSKIRKQEEYNEKIRNSDLCFFIFFTKAGEYTREEFEVARKKFEETGKPKIYTYFKVIKDETAEQSLYDFMDELDKIFGHYYGTFEHIDTVKLRILLNLKLQEMDFLEIKVDGDTCVVDGKKTLSLENVSEFANNSIFQELKAELYEIEERYFKLKAKYEKDECSQSEEREYIEIATKRQTLIDAIEEIQKNIFNMSLRMCQDEARGEITLRQKEAYRLFEAGDLEGANNILDFTEIENDYLRDMAIMEANMRKRSGIFIRETQTKIDILKTMTKLPTRFAEIEELYDKILPIVFKFNIEYDTAFDCVNYLYDQNKDKLAINISEKLLDCNIINKETSNNNIAKVYNLLSCLYNRQNQYAKAEEYRLMAIRVYENLKSSEFTEKVASDLAENYDRMGGFLGEQCRPNEAMKYHLKSLDLYKQLSEKHPQKFKIGLSACYHNIAILCEEQCQPEKAKEFYLKSLELVENFSGENSENIKLNIATTYNNVGSLYMKQHWCGAEKYILQSFNIIESLSKENPQKFTPWLAMCYTNLYILYSEPGPISGDIESYPIIKALKIYQKLSEENPERFNEELALCYKNVGVFYRSAFKYSEAETNFLKCLEILEKLQKTKSKKLNDDLATAYQVVGDFYSERKEFQKAEKLYLNAIEIREDLARDNPERFNPKLANSYFGLANATKKDIYFDNTVRIAETNPEHPYCEAILASVRALREYSKTKSKDNSEKKLSSDVNNGISDCSVCFNKNKTIILNDENGNEAEFEFLDLIVYEEEEYAVLLPVEESDEAGEVVILKLEETENYDEESYVSVDDDDTLMAVFNIFKDKFKDEFNFVD